MLDNTYYGRLVAKIMEGMDPQTRWLIDNAETDELENWRIDLTMPFVHLTGEPYGQVYKALRIVIREISGREVGPFYGKHEGLPSRTDG